MEPEEREALAHSVLDARLAAGLTKAEAARNAGVSDITWKRVEDGKGVQDVKLAAILRAVGLSDQPATDPDDAPPTLREAADAELLAEIARRFGRAAASDPEIDAIRASDRPRAEQDQVIADISRRRILDRRRQDEHRG